MQTLESPQASTPIRGERDDRPMSFPADLVPTPTIEYRQQRKLDRVSIQTSARPADAQPLPIPIPRIPIPIPFPLLHGTRVLIWKQDPSVAEIGIRKVALPAPVLAGPRDARITSKGLPTVSPNVLGDFIQAPFTDAFDAVQAFAVVRMTLTMFQRALGGDPVKWQWNSTTNTDPLAVFAHGLPGTMNAFYSRNDKALKFGDFIRPNSSPPEKVFTCRSLDIVSHECGHAVLDGLKPSWLSFGNPPQTGALHEAFGDITAIFLALSQFDEVEAVIAQTRANLHDKTFLSDLAEQFGLALGRPNGLRNADNNLKLSQVSNEVHDLSQVFTGAIYDILADIFAFERNWRLKDDAAVLYQSAQYLMSLLLRAIQAAPASGAKFADVANQMLNIAASDGKPVQYRNFIRNQFTVREVVVSPTPLIEDHEEGLELEAAPAPSDGMPQLRGGCCGTMRNLEYLDEEAVLAEEIQDLKRVCSSDRSRGKAPAEMSLPPAGRAVAGRTKGGNGHTNKGGSSRRTR